MTICRPAGMVSREHDACPYTESTFPVKHDALNPLRAPSVSTYTGAVAELFTFTVGVPLMLTVGVPMLAFTVPVTGSGVFVTLTGMEGVGGAAASGTRLGLAPTVPVVMTTATAASTSRPRAIEILFFSGYIDFPPSSFVTTELAARWRAPIELSADTSAVFASRFPQSA